MTTGSSSSNDESTREALPCMCRMDHGRPWKLAHPRRIMTFLVKRTHPREEFKNPGRILVAINELMLSRWTGRKICNRLYAAHISYCSPRNPQGLAPGEKSSACSGANQGVPCRGYTGTRYMITPRITPSKAKTRGHDCL